MKTVVILWLFWKSVFSYEISHFIDKILKHHENLEYNSIHSKFGFLIASKLNSKYSEILDDLSKKPIFEEENLSKDVRSGNLF